MRTTVDINDDLLIKAKKRAVELHKPLRALIEEGLKMCLSANKKHRKTHKSVRWIIEDGGLPEGLDISDRNTMHEWIRNKK